MDGNQFCLTAQRRNLQKIHISICLEVGTASDLLHPSTKHIILTILLTVLPGNATGRWCVRIRFLDPLSQYFTNSNEPTVVHCGEFSHIHMISVDSKGGAVRQHGRTPRHDLFLGVSKWTSLALSDLQSQIPLLTTPRRNKRFQLAPILLQYAPRALWIRLDYLQARFWDCVGKNRRCLSAWLSWWIGSRAWPN